MKIPIKVLELLQCRLLAGELLCGGGRFLSFEWRNRRVAVPGASAATTKHPAALLFDVRSGNVADPITKV